MSISGYPILSISSSKIKLFITDNEDDKLNVISYYEVQHQAIRNCNLVDAKELLKKIKKLIDKTNFFLNTKITDIILIFPECNIDIIEGESRIQVSKENRSINAIDIKKLLRLTAKKEYNHSKDILNIFPISFSVNNVVNIDNPNGIIGKFLGLEYFAISIEKEFFLNILNVIEQLNIRILETIPNFYSIYSYINYRSGIDTLNIVEIDYEQTMISIFDDGVPFKFKLLKKGISDLLNILATRYQLNKDNTNILFNENTFLYDKESKNTIMYKLELLDKEINITEKDIAQICSNYLSDLSSEIKEFLDYFSQYTSKPLFIGSPLAKKPGFKELMKQLFRNYDLRFIEKDKIIGLREYITYNLQGAMKIIPKREMLLHNNLKTVKIGINDNNYNKIAEDDILQKENFKNDKNKEKSFFHKIISYFFD